MRRCFNKGTITCKQTEARDVSFGAGLTLNVIPYDLFGSEPELDYENLSVRAVRPDERGLCFLPDDNRPDQLFAFTPEMAILENGAGLSFSNIWSYDAGTQVEIWLLGGLDCTLDGDHVKEGDWVRVGTAAVSSDGSKLETEFRLPCLTWIGLKLVE